MPILDLISNQLYYESQTVLDPQGTIIFVHGSGGTTQVWNKQMQALSEDWNCVAIDLPGHGKSTSPACQSVTEAALLLKTFIEKQSFPKPIYLTGHSLGAAIALHYACYYSEDAAGIILIGGGAKLRVLPQILDSLSRNELQADFVRLTFSPNCPAAIIAAQTELYMRNCPAVLYDDFNACNQFDLTGELSAVTLPALIIVGRDDVLTPIKYAEYLHTHLPDTQLVIVEKAGHFAMLEQPDAVNRAILNFINNFPG